MMYAISYNIGPRYNGTQQYIVDETHCTHILVVGAINLPVFINSFGGTTSVLLSHPRVRIFVNSYDTCLG